MAVLWIDNQAAGCKGVCDRVNYVNTSALKHPTLCTDGECKDGILLDGLDARLSALPAERRAKGVLIVLHQMGSHGPAYYKRVPDAHRHFQPECRTNNLQQCSQAQLDNSYDNTIRYTDHLLGEAQAWAARQSGFATGLLYISDHGESLGENNIYLHGLPYAFAPDVQKHVPLVSWLSPALQAQTQIKTSCLQARSAQPLTHDNFFHSLLGLLDVQTSLYQRELDWFAPCQGQR